MSNLPDEQDLYYLQDKRTICGNSMMWWGKGRAGYVCDIREAHIFTKEEAQRQHEARKTDIPWRKSYIDARIRHHIDFQYCERADVEAA